MEAENLDFVMYQVNKLLTDHNVSKKNLEIYFAGSQSILFLFPKIKREEIVHSMEVDLFTNTHDRPHLEKDLFDKFYTAFGEGSPLHEEYMFYMDFLEYGTVKLPENWESRKQKIDTKEGIDFYSISVYDLVLSKYIAHREKDLTYNEFIVRGSLVQKKKLLKILHEEYPDIDPVLKDKIKAKINLHFTMSNINLMRNDDKAEDKVKAEMK